jgi:non-ribosomal peptide synthase protein (TIGR01720 family)
MQLVSRARRAGLRHTPRDVFTHRTVARLARLHRDRPDRPAPVDVPIGEVPLTPIMRWLAERNALTERFGQSMTLHLPPGVRATALTSAVQAVLDHHDLLRARLVQHGGDAGWVLQVPPPGSVTSRVSVVDARSLDDRGLADARGRTERAALDALDAAAGAMLQAVFLDRGPDRPGQLLLLIHHLVVDVVSWRVLLPDLLAAADGKAQLAPVGTSFRRWSNLLTALARDPQEVAALPAWIRVLDGPDPLLGERPADPAVDRMAGRASASYTVPAPRTTPLLAGVVSAFGVSVDEVLLAGLAVAVARWRRRRGRRHTALLVDVEGHGREHAVGDVDLSRTVGWFTSVFPVRLDPGPVELGGVLAGGAAAGEVLKRVKEQLRAVPGSGLSYGLLRYLNPQTGPDLAGLPVPQVGFNYLGRFPAGQGRLGVAHGPALPVAHVLDIDALVHDGPGGPELRASFGWVPEILDEAAVRELADDWLAALDGLGAHASRPGAGGLTPSDVPLVRLTQDELQALESEFGGDDRKEVWDR